MLCENCGLEEKKKYGSGRFCSQKCARNFSTKLKRKEINSKVSKTLKGRKYPPGRKSWNYGIKFSFDDERNKKRIEKIKLKHHYKMSLFSFNNAPMAEKIRRILEEQKSQCNRCKISDWQGIQMKFHLNHINGKKCGDTRENLELLCPNCHYLTHNWGMRGKSPSNKGKHNLSPRS